MQTQLDIAQLINEQVHKAVTDHIVSIDVKQLITEAVSVAVDSAVSKITSSTIDALVRQRDIPAEISALVSKEAKSQIESQAKIISRTALGQLDVKTLMATAVADHLSVKVNEYNFPHASIPATSIRWDDVTFSGDKVQGGIIRNFNSTGIQDQATDCQLTIVDGVIVAEKHFISKSLQADDARFKTMTAEGTVTLVGNIELGDVPMKTITKIVDDRLNTKLDGAGLDIGEGKIVSGKSLVLDSTTLGPSVTQSNLRKLGLLMDLRVSGPTNLSETLFVTEGNRIGVNTEDPTGVITVWDEDAELTVKKQSRRNMFVGSTRPTDLSIGTNGRSQITVTQDGIDLSDPIRIQGVRFSVSDTVPEREGEVMEIVMVRTAREDQPRFYICQGRNSWRALA